VRYAQQKPSAGLDYIKRLKRAAIPLWTIAVLSSGAALAQDQLTKADLVQLAVTLGVYDNRRKARSQAAGRCTAHGPNAR
jgi:hypothetical protein